MLNSNILREAFSGSSDIVFMDIYVNKNRNKDAVLVFVEGLVNAEMVNEHILRPLTEDDSLGNLSDDEMLNEIQKGSVYHLSHKIKDNPDEIITDILSGNAVIMLDKLQKAVIFEVKGFQMRGISESSQENVIKGSKDSFIEVLRINTALIRRRINSPKLKLTEIPVGGTSATQIGIMYIEGVAKTEMVEEVVNRLQRIDIDAVQSLSNIEEGIADRKYSAFPQTIYTERPDKVCANLQEGKIAMIVDGYPVVYIIPAVFNMFFQSSEDYSQNFAQSSIIRVLRYIGAFLSLILPAFYVSIVTFHHEMIPAKMAKAIIESKEAVPFSSMLEVLLMLTAFEILVESGIRLPKAMGQAISIVGGLIIGDAAVNANFVSPAVVVIVAVTGICGFIIPNQDLSNSFRIMRFILVVCAEFVGLYGLSLGLIMILYYTCTLTTFGAPYMKPYKTKKGNMLISDGFLRLP